MSNNKIGIEFEDDYTLIITAIENGDTKDAIQMIEEIKEESKEIIKPINLN